MEKEFFRIQRRVEVTDWTGKALFLFDTGSEGGEKYDVADSFGGEGLDLRPAKG